ncbi:hypothetical protein HKBW3S44_01145 [Candidatus Hakubella thermalkaliphila]|uniref:Uncharacterized protein n=1 Tax=Candidatus Hakubella thermalkaliphila TaxID=2754717 RepID=A0A6V8PY39_9ACTN|nr:hypothetical protein HKBW3S44_01145 [Candidatus Hakubella thermalkaliphila]
MSSLPCTTLDRYGHLLPEVHNQAAERLDQTLLGENFSSKIVAIRSEYEKKILLLSDNIPSD